MTEGAGAFRDLARLRGGASKPRGGRPESRRGACGRRPASLCPRRETRGRSPARLGRRGVSAEPAAAGPRACALGLHVARASGQVAAEGDRRPSAGMLAGWPQLERSRQPPGGTLWPKRVAFPPPPRHVASSNFLLDESLGTPVSLSVPAAAQPRWLPLLPTHPGSRAAAGWRDPLRTVGRVDSGFGAPGQVEGSLRASR